MIVAEFSAAVTEYSRDTDTRTGVTVVGVSLEDGTGNNSVRMRHDAMLTPAQNALVEAYRSRKVVRITVTVEDA